MNTHKNPFSFFATTAVRHAGPSVAYRRLAATFGSALSLAAVVMAPHLSAYAQTPALTPATGNAAAEPSAAPQAASAASAARPARRYLTQDEKRESATAPGAMRPVDPVVPQLRIALGRDALAASGAATGAIDDDAARCRAQASATDRARCGAGTQKVVPKPSLRP